MARYIILDTETTGTGDLDRIIQLGYMVLGAKEVEVQNEFFSCDVPISFGAMEVHGITPDMLEGKSTCKESKSYKRLQELNTNDNYLIIHNAPFDIGMLEKEGFKTQMKVIDTLRVAKHILPDEEAHRLQYFRYKMGIYKEEQKEADALGITIKAHDAIGDVLVLKLLLSRLKEAVMKQFPSQNPVDKMADLTATPILVKSFNFGKYKGKTLQEVAAIDAAYLRWMLSGMENLDSDMRYSINTVLGI
ncbi:MAG: DNA polymerase III subunit epsilon [Sulfurimonas sp. RIFOXYD12_FULL_33_39]|uniref:3'-5' exonuclease n=1 Tax=unclassified Sulfurimonas TaxID=2623549 RepID=UPI0008C8ADFD|nr:MULTISPECIES: 3'-5' exonuclease [unclassified Sulfurimonas]OHE09677.1 MAG: DNA polymerase III subunit epsilon [Sulfurimonas sp. RIFOXYD12_FULL_33_39]OHE13815.1 MAG: DNA polymerase III subunit epsilon [Sulfurimonas sp. RIFOXYD2_FULL_34_21]DAB28416.1 MAG TPA: DNA polymerase III subunit epsilon [Sulfurimonas sp. UBA10385]